MSPIRISPPSGPFAENHILKLLNGGKIAIHQNREGGAVGGRGGGAANAACDHHKVLGLDRLLHRVRAQVEAGELERIHPDPESGVAGAEDVHLAHTLGAGEWIVKIELEETVQIVAVELALG